MPAYAYPIKILRTPRTVHFEESKTFDSNSLTIAELIPFVGDDPFSVQELEWGGYEISVTRTRKETKEELANRVAKEESYMKEYEKRHPKH